MCQPMQEFRIRSTLYADICIFYSEESALPLPLDKDFINFWQLFDGFHFNWPIKMQELWEAEMSSSTFVFWQLIHLSVPPTVFFLFACLNESHQKVFKICLASCFLLKKLGFETPPPQSFQWPSLGWAWIFSETFKCCHFFLRTQECPIDRHPLDPRLTGVSYLTTWSTCTLL